MFLNKSTWEIRFLSPDGAVTSRSWGHANKSWSMGIYSILCLFQTRMMSVMNSPPLLLYPYIVFLITEETLSQSARRKQILTERDMDHFQHDSTITHKIRAIQLFSHSVKHGKYRNHTSVTPVSRNEQLFNRFWRTCHSIQHQKEMEDLVAARDTGVMHKKCILAVCVCVCVWRYSTKEKLHTATVYGERIILIYCKRCPVSFKSNVWRISILAWNINSQFIPMDYLFVGITIESMIIYNTQWT